MPEFDDKKRREGQQPSTERPDDSGSDKKPPYSDLSKETMSPSDKLRAFADSHRAPEPSLKESPSERLAKFAEKTEPSAEESREQPSAEKTQTSPEQTEPDRDR